MGKRVEVMFQGGLKVAARVGDHVIHTDQPQRAGGEGTAPTPMELFLAALATCSALYALEFCRSRQISEEGLGLVLEAERDEQRRIYSPIRIILKLPGGFPDKYRQAIVRAVGACTVKRHIEQKPEFEVVLE